MYLIILIEESYQMSYCSQHFTNHSMLSFIPWKVSTSIDWTYIVTDNFIITNASKKVVLKQLLWVAELTFHGCTSCVSCNTLATSTAGIAWSPLLCVHAHTNMGASRDAQCNMVDSIILSDSKPASVNDCIIRMFKKFIRTCKNQLWWT